jgi:hypothetical protein
MWESPRKFFWDFYNSSKELMSRIGGKLPRPGSSISSAGDSAFLT